MLLHVVREDFVSLSGEDCEWSRSKYHSYDDLSIIWEHLADELCCSVWIFIVH